MKLTKVGIVGFGRMGQLFHKHLTSLDNVQVPLVWKSRIVTEDINVPHSTTKLSNDLNEVTLFGHFW